MRTHIRLFIIGIVAALVAIAHAQTPRASALPPPTTKAAVGEFDAKIVERAAQLVATEAQWNRSDKSACHTGAKTFGIACALNKAIEEAAGVGEAKNPPPAGDVGSPTPSDCRFHPAGSDQEGGCGMLFDEVPVITIAKVPAITTGVWRKDAQPTEVWAGKMSDAESPIQYEADELVTAISGKKGDDRLLNYNNDSATTFADVQSFFKSLKERVIKNGAADLDDATDDVEIEIYAGGTGVIRTYEGWFPVTNFSMQDSQLRFRVGLTGEVPPNDLDRQIIQRAAAMITDDAVWNRADNRKCPAGAKTISIYCAEEQATIEVTGGFHHRRPALELVRVIVEDRSKDKSYNHRLMDYNNDPSTKLADVKSLFAEALAKIK